MSTAQLAVVESMLSNHERINLQLASILPDSAMLNMYLKMQGLSRAELWKPLIDSIAKLRPEQFDTLMIELNHYIQKGLAVESSDRELKILESAST